MEKAKEQKAFLELKRAEIRPGDYFSMTGYMEAQESWRTEQSLVSGYVVMLRTKMTGSCRGHDPEIQKLLKDASSLGAAFPAQRPAETSFLWFGYE